MAEKRELLSKGNNTKVEKVENRGTFRIVGQVFKDASSKTAIGYGVIDVKNVELRLFTTKQTIELLRRYKFENAVLDSDDKVINTECSMDRLIKFDTQKNVIGNAGITILGQVILNGADYGYRVLNPQGKVVDISEETLLCVSKNGEGTPILNAKVIKEGVSKPYVSAIRGDFKRIEISEFEKLQSEYNSKEIKEAHKKYLEKQKYAFARKLINTGYVGVTSAKESKKGAKRLLTEYFIPKYPFLALDKSLTVTEILTLAYLFEVAEGTYSKFNAGKFAKFKKAVNRNGYTIVPRFGLDVLNVASSNGFEDVAEALRVVNDLTDGTIRVYEGGRVVLDKNQNLVEYVSMFVNKRVSKRENLQHEEYNPATFDYESVQGIEVLGYTVNKARVKQEVKSPMYTKPIKLRWALEGIDRLPCDTDFILDNITCFGDLELMRKVIKHHGQFLHPRYIDPEICKLKAEAYLFILACNNLVLAEYVNKMCDNFSKLPLTEINKEKFPLDENDKLFYLSGGKFNRSINLKTTESWSNPSDSKGALSSFTGGYFAAMALYMTIDGHQEKDLLN